MSGWGNYRSLPGDTYLGNPDMGYVTGFSAGDNLMAILLRGMGGDLNGDGRPDLFVHVLTSQLGVGLGDTRVSLTGKTLGGDVFEGSDRITTLK